METASLLNIKSKAHQSTDVMTGQALAMVSSDKNKTDGFKSAFNNQMDNKRNDDIRAEKKLPHNGNELPEKKSAANKNDDNHKFKDSDDQIKNARHQNSNSENNSKQIDDAHVKDNAQAGSHEQANSHEQQNSHEQANSHEQQNSHEQTSAHEAANSQEQENSSESVKNYGQTLADTKAVDIAASQQAEAAVDSELSEQQTVLQQQSQQQVELTPGLNSVNSLNSEQTKSAISSDSLHSDKKIQGEAFRGQAGINQPASSANLFSPMAANAGSGSGSEGKNESALTKSIAEFQQFIEMSKKHSMAGETIASVKSFEQSMKTEQTNAQLLLNNIKLPAAQLAAQANQSTPLVMQSISPDRINSPLNSSPLSFTQTVSSLEVKTPVGKAGWGQNFSNQIIMMANNGVQQAKIKLNPVTLGPVEAMVKLSGETAVINLTSLHLTTKEAMESAIPRLKEMLNENGFSQVDVNVSHQDKQQQEAALANKEHSNTGSNNEHGNSTMPGDEQLSEETLDSETGTQVSDSDEQGLNIVDYYA